MTGLIPACERAPAPWRLPPGFNPVAVVVCAACGYEVAAILSRGKIPTISALQFRYPPLGSAVLIWLTWHFARYQPAEFRKGPHEELAEESRWLPPGARAVLRRPL